MFERFFPQGIATENYFCNREKEREALKNSILSHEHTVLIAPRRYGKTSLITQVLKENDFPGINIDFFFVLQQSEVSKMIAEGVSDIINLLLPKSKSACNKIIDTILTFNPKLTINAFGQKLELTSKQVTEKSISELLLALDKVAEQVKKTCVIVFDEFQQIGELKENHAVEAAIRHAVERSTYVSYIFCGSRRHLLNEMFSDKSRPLYHLCDLMTIDRIESSFYVTFLQTMAKKKWKKMLDADCLDEILSLTENHPYYVNALCRRLWRQKDKPTLSEVRNSWNEYVDQQQAWIIDDLSRLTLNRRKVLIGLAYYSTREPLGQDFSGTVGLNPSGIKKSITDLERLDIIYRDKNKYYRILDPAVEYFIRQYSLR